MTDNAKSKILLHVCCSMCSPYVLKILSREFIPVIYFYNPNIQPKDEFYRRKLDIEGYVRSLGLDFHEGTYDDFRWNYMTEGLHDEPEGGARCEICFKMRMNKIALKAIELGIDWFTTTLSVSPYKNSRVINRICKELAKDYKINYYKADFKKNDGAKISYKMAKDLDFYRQDYCGCLPSLHQAHERRRQKDEMQRQSHQIISPLNQ